MPRIGKSLETENRLGSPESGGREEMTANGSGLSFWGDKNVLELENCYSYTTLWIYVHFKRVNFLICEFYLYKTVITIFN